MSKSNITGVHPTHDQDHILFDVLMERVRQDAKWGEQNHPDLYWNVILGEERGEVEKALCEDDDEQVERELVQLTAVALSWLESRARRRRRNNTPEAIERRATANALHGDDLMP